jgi:hypothetical protein
MMKVFNYGSPRKRKIISELYDAKPTYDSSRYKKNEMFILFDRFKEEYVVYNNIHLGEEYTEEYRVECFRSSEELDCVQFIKDYYEGEGRFNRR